jgi:RNA polymerase sigma-70 factor (ECF subfamily)
MPLSPDERTLLEGCRAGDEEAWLALYRAYAGDLGRYLQGMLRNSSEIEDLVQRVFLEFLSSLDRYRGEAGLRTWLHRIARHVALHDIRSRERRERHVRGYAETVEDRTQSPEPQLEARDRLEQVQGLLAHVDEPFREVWLLRELQGFSVAEVADIADIPAATVRTRHHRARERLFALLNTTDKEEAQRLQTPDDVLQLVWSKGGKA